MTPPDSAQFPNAVVAARALSQQVPTADGMLAILSEVELAVQAGETLAVTGASGSGKSTLLGLLAGLDQPTSGEIVLLGQRLNDLDEDARARLRAGRIGFVFQSFQLLPALTALENILLPLELAGRADARERATHWLDRVGLAARAGHT
ncbi:MAG: ATP-binding cassette domain-containing protein, partial [Thiobacillus sp.]